MRDAESIRRAGRNDPDSSAQQREHPYDFVQFADRIHSVEPDWLQRRRDWGLWHSAEWRLSSVQPLGVGSGLIGLVNGKPTRLITVDVQGRPVVPGPSLKGAVRAIYEAITRSCVAGPRTRWEESAKKLPKAFNAGSSGRPVSVEPTQRPEALRGQCSVRERPLRLCPACALFGTLGYRGRVAFEDAVIEPSQDGRDVVEVFDNIPALSSGQLHRVGEASYTQGVVRLERLWGRRWPLKPTAVRRAQGDEGRERMEALRPHTRLKTRIVMMGLADEEVGGLLVAMGLGRGQGLLRLGGSKPNGFGLVETEDVALPRPATEYHEQFDRWQGYWRQGYDDLKTIMTREVNA